MSENIQTVTGEGAEPVTDQAAGNIPDIDANAQDVVGSEASAEPVGEGASTEPPKEPGKDETPPWLKAEVTKERNRRRAAEERERQKDEQIDRLTRALGERSPDQAKPEASDKPRREDFFDPDEYEAAKDAWIIQEAEKRIEAKTTRTNQEQAQVRQIEEARTAWSAKVEAANKTHPDFEEVIYSDEFQCSSAMMNAIVADPNGAEVAYHLATNPDESARVNRLPPFQQVIEIGRLSATLTAKPANVSRAPAPIRPLGNEAPIGRKDPAEETEAEYMARRSAEVRANRERLF